MLESKILKSAAVLAVVSLVSACAMGGDSAYRSSRSVQQIEAPPGLSESAFGTSMPVPALASAQGANAGIVGSSAFTAQESVDKSLLQIRRVGDKRWLVISANPEDIWPSVREFWLENDFLVEWEDQALGIMETNWRERPAAIAKSGIAGFFAKTFSLMYSSDLKDRYRVRIEFDENSGKSELFLTHRGLAGDLKGSEFSKNYFWSWRPSDPEMEAEMLSRMLLFIGLDEERVKELQSRTLESTPLAVLKGDSGQRFVQISRSKKESWKLVGMALEREGLMISESNPGAGYYQVRYQATDIKDLEDQVLEVLDNPEGYRISVIDDENSSSRIEVVAGNGESAVDSRVGTLVLEKILNQLN